MVVPKNNIKTHSLYSLLCLVLLLCDRLTKDLALHYLRTGDKEIIPGVFSLHYLENRGAAWGMLQDATWLFVIITVVVLLAMSYLYGRIPMTKRYRLLRFAIVLLASGALGNFIDRIMWRYVVDFLYFKYINFPVFNLADCYVCIAAALLIYCIIFRYKDEDFLWKKKK